MEHEPAIRPPGTGDGCHGRALQSPGRGCARDGGLADLAVVLSATPDVRIRVEAFVDATSDPEADSRLSASMAQAAVKRLGDLGVAADRLSWAGRGGESPLLPNFTVRGRAANRRIEIVGLP